VATTRRVFLQLLAGAPLLAAARPARAGKNARIVRLIKETYIYPEVSQRIDFISRALLGIRYEANTLIGGPRHQEVFVVRDDAFDCVTYCEVVLAAALSKNLREFEAVLRRIRYQHGNVKWAERNHDFAKWSERAVENKICRPVRMLPSVAVEKILTGDELGKRRFVIAAIPAPTFLANRGLLRSGDIIGFVSRRENLDFFHIGFLAFGVNGNLLLRHASRSQGRVLDEDLKGFLAANGAKYITLLRAENVAPTSS
jgi:hypothetical protein